MGPVRTFRSAFGRVLAGGMALVAGLSLVLTAAEGGLADVVRSGGVPALVAAMTWALFWSPALEVSDGELTVRNVFRTFHVPWPCLQRVTTTWTLRLETTDGPVTVWATPIGGVWAARREESVGGGVAPTAARAVEERQEALRAAGYLAMRTIQEVHVTVRWHVGTIATLIALATWVWLGTALA
jgi:Bacterial PH domain